LPLVNKAHQANQLYPYAVGLLESVRAYELSTTKVILLKKINFVILSFERLMLIMVKII
jgi:hypothetical protein